VWGGRGKFEASPLVEMMDIQEYEGGGGEAGSSRACKRVLRCVLASQSYAQGRSECKYRAVDCVLLRRLNYVSGSLER